MAEQYDPRRGPSPKQWLEMDEAERLQAVERFHHRARIEISNHQLHAVVHTIVETQIAMGEETEAEATLKRLLSEDFDRHDAVHAIGSVLFDHMYQAQLEEIK